jgi:hypothetical protein
MSAFAEFPDAAALVQDQTVDECRLPDPTNTPLKNVRLLPVPEFLREPAHLWRESELVRHRLCRVTGTQRAILLKNIEQG